MSKWCPRCGIIVLAGKIKCNKSRKLKPVKENTLYCYECADYLDDLKKENRAGWLTELCKIGNRVWNHFSKYLKDKKCRERI